MRIRGFILYVAVLLGAIAGPALADTVYLSDGSRINGDVQWMSADTLAIKTGFAGTMSLAREQVAGVDTDDAVRLALDSGRQLAGRLAYDSEARQQAYIVDGERRMEPKGSARLGAIALIAPQVVAANAKSGEEEDYELPEADTEAPKNQDYWSGRFELSLNGNSGNTHNRTLLTKVSGLRDTGDTRLSLSASVDKEQEDGKETADEYLGKGRYESDFTDRAFWFAQQHLEKDPFENIDLRSRTLVGPGYFLVRRDRLTFKVRTGVGYQYEDYTDSGSSGEMIFLAGWDYAQLFGEWLKLTHEFNIYPEVTNTPSKNFVLESALGAELPIANSRVWSIRGELDHDYNNNPEPGVEKLDTSYQLGIVRDF